MRWQPDRNECYCRLLGLAEIPKPPALAARGGVWFQCGTQQRGMTTVPGSGADACDDVTLRRQSGRDPVSRDLALLSIRVETDAAASDNAVAVNDEGRHASRSLRSPMQFGPTVSLLQELGSPTLRRR